MRGKKILNFSIIAISFTVLMLAFVAVAPPVFADDCTTTVTAPDSIQTAVDAASSGDVVCLDDSGGAFAQQVVFDSSDSGITLTAADDSSPVLDGSTLTGSTTISAIELLSGVTDVTIRGLEIKNYVGDSSGSDRSSGIVAASGTTSDIKIEKNNIHDNFWNGILVFSAGDFEHDNWEVEKNDVTDNGFVGIELTNTGESSVSKNDVKDNDIGIVIQARNTIAGSGLFTHPGDVSVIKNTVSGSFRNIYILSLASGPLDPFPPIVGAQTSLSGVVVEKNEISDCQECIWLLGFGGGTLSETEVVKNTIVTNSDAAAIGIRAPSFGSGLTEKSNIEKNDITAAGNWAIILAGADDNEVLKNTLLATNPAPDRTGDDAVLDNGVNNQLIKND